VGNSIQAETAGKGMKQALAAGDKSGWLIVVSQSHASDMYKHTSTDTLIAHGVENVKETHGCLWDTRRSSPSGEKWPFQKYSLTAQQRKEKKNQQVKRPSK
jgi:hypothetical protein